MSDYSARLTGKIRAHLEGIVRSSGLPGTDASLETMARLWFGKKAMFEAQARLLRMDEVECLPKEDPRGALLLTYSGSLLGLSPRVVDSRSLEYASIETRTDVPRLLVAERTDLAADLRADREAAFSGGPVKSTSAVLAIAVCAADVSLEEQDKRIREAMIFLTNGFMKLNRTALTTGDRPVEQFTAKSIVTYLARRNGLTQRQTRRLVEDYLAMVEAGMLLGERVPLGRLGRLSLRRRPARKAKVGINPATGEPITIAAKPEEAVPRISFSRPLKERARRVELPD
jgi:nucleoid DNA-binding protein